MILDTARFTARELPAWQELERLLDDLAERTENRLSLEEASRLRALYHRVCAGLTRVEHGAPRGELCIYLENLAGRAYAEIYGARRRFARPRLRQLRESLREFFVRVPRVFRAHLAAFALALAITVAGCAFGAVAVAFDPAGVNVLLPADYLRNPAQRVSQAEHPTETRSPQDYADLSATVIANNIRVSILAFALGMTFGIGTGLVLLTNGVLLGAVAAQYTRLGFGVFVAGWLLPHGAFEIPSILIAGQAGFVLAAALRRSGRRSRKAQFQTLLPDLLTLVGGLCCLLLWAGLVEGFFSQRHAPSVPYAAKIAAGLAELVLLTSYLLLAGRTPERVSLKEAAAS